jgi:hypothetical protein
MDLAAGANLPLFYLLKIVVSGLTVYDGNFFTKSYSEPTS